MTLTLDGAPAPAVDAPTRRFTMPWTRTALWLLLAGTAVLYLWDLGASGWANDFYAASAQSGSMSWKAWLFASLDPGNAITVDKPPAAMWVMGLSMRLFGVNSGALLVPQALMGVGSVALLAATVRRWFGPVAGLIAGAILALTPVAVLMFRFDNPDALLVLLMTAAAYTTVRSLDRGSWRWLAGTGVLLGFAFLTKMLQGFLVLPGFALAYLFCAPLSWLRRIRDLLIAGAALLVSGGWLVALVSIWPASSRPYIAGSTNNSLWQLAIGYNGLGRIFGGDGNRGGGGGGGGFGGGSMFGGAPGFGRMFGSSFGLEISWLLPAALVALVALVGLLALAARQFPVRASALIWGAWTLVTALTFSFMSGTVHPYYSIALAPGIAALVAIGLRVLWDLRAGVAARAFLAAMVLATGVWDFVLLGRVSWAPSLRWVILVAGILVAGVLLVPPARVGRAALAVAAAGVLPLGLGSAAWGVTTAGTAHTGSTPTAGPAGVSTGGFGGGAGGGFPGGGRFRGSGNGSNGGDFPGGGPNGAGFPGGSAAGSGSADGNGSVAGNGSADGNGSAAGGGSAAGNGAGGDGSGSGNGDAAGGAGLGSASGGTGSADAGTGSPAGGDGVRAYGNGRSGNGSQRNRRGGFGGGQADAAVVTLLKSAGDVRWAAATNGSMEAAPLQLASGESVMAIGGFTGSDPSPTLAQFQKYVADGDVRYYLSGGRGSGNQIEQWVAANFAATTVGGSTVYDLTRRQ
ncbi:glycosyltransferase family 39 protein [Actinoplanes sp. NPDC051411]|uniref:ArnT family glycosyltransferase n=1 Tax=Actinoplanes sp. NPDC051411 TaxID=3155522 RepID=UPI00342AE338